MNESIRNFYEDWQDFYQSHANHNPDQLTLDEYAILDEQETVQPVSFEAIQKHLAQKAQEGFSDDIRQLIQNMGANKLSELEPSNYTILWQEVEALGHDG